MMTKEQAEEIISQWDGTSEAFVYDGSIYTEADVQEAVEIINKEGLCKN